MSAYRKNAKEDTKVDVIGSTFSGCLDQMIEKLEIKYQKIAKK